jgi:hypothetical protein
VLMRHWRLRSDRVHRGHRVRKEVPRRRSASASNSKPTDEGLSKSHCADVLRRRHHDSPGRQRRTRSTERRQEEGSRRLRHEPRPRGAWARPKRAPSNPGPSGCRPTANRPRRWTLRTGLDSYGPRSSSRGWCPLPFRSATVPGSLLLWSCSGGSHVSELNRP